MPRSAVFFLCVLNAIAWVIVGWALLFFTFYAMAYVAIGLAVVAALLAIATARYETRSGLGLVEVDGDASADPHDRSTWQTAVLEARRTRGKTVKVGYVHWLPEFEGPMVGIGVGDGPVIFVADGANSLKLNRKTYDPGPIPLR